jgi:tRNA pseudouridine38-40 synthase
MSRYVIQFSYDGGTFHGYQIQPNAHSVQAELEEKLSLLLGIGIEITGSSRTDSGVHAKQQFAHFDLPEEIILGSDFIYRVNRMFSPSLAIQHIYVVSDDFHARFNALSRTYEYLISTSKNPLMRQYAYWFETSLDVKKMNLAADMLIKHSNFQCFSKVKTEVTTFECDIKKAFWEFRGDHLVFTIQANRFLRGMVRSVVGTMIEIGLGNWGLSDLDEILNSNDRQKAGRSVPAHGLYLIQVEYPKATFDAKCS